jgi:furin
MRPARKGSGFYIHIFFKLFSLFVTVVSSFEVNDEIVLSLLKNGSKSPEEIVYNLTKTYDLRYKHKLFNEYHVFELRHSERGKRSISDKLKKIGNIFRKDSNIKWFEIQENLFRQKRDFVDLRNHEKKDDWKFKYFKEELNQLNPCLNESSFHLNDPEWASQWYINDGCSQGFYLNITYAWKMGYTGKGVVTTIIDDGLEKDNLDLIDNYDSRASFDLNDNDMDPQPRYDLTNENKHGTRCAGEIAAKPNNSFCAVGVAFDCRIGGIRLLDGKITDRLEAEALTYNLDYIDIFSASWGPLDNGKTVDGPGTLSTEAFARGIANGRKGKGAIYVWAAGNGGRYKDNCNCDGYTSSIFTITIGGITQEGRMPGYSEKCSATLASTFSSGMSQKSGIITSDLHSGCTKHHSGTSASAPIAAGIIALALEANPELTWRDVQYLIVETSRPFNVNRNDWQLNAAGRYYSHNFGFGLMNAGRMVELAHKWKNVGKQLKCDIFYIHQPNGSLVVKKKESRIFSLNVYTTKFKDSMRKSPLQNTCTSNLNYLEHVVSVLTLKSGVRGQIKINLISPSNTKSNLLEYRERDLSKKGFKAWPFMSVHFWGENLNGKWLLEIINNSNLDLSLNEWRMTFYGVENQN